MQFYNISKSVKFPDDQSLDIYDTMYIDQNIPWTVLSWKIYNTIDYWWVLNNINLNNGKFYAEKQSTIKFIKPQVIDDILTLI